MTMNISRLGFGLSSIAGSGNFSHQEKLIKTAIENGITHFDVAPYYGSGDAEKILGNILATCSEKVTITTKFGLAPLSGGRGGSMLRSLLRPVFGKVSFLKRIATSALKSNKDPQEKVFKNGALSASVEESVHKLRRPIDILLLHDANIQMARNFEIIEELDLARKGGNVCLTGISGDATSVLDAVVWRPQTYTVAQLENSLAIKAPIDQLYSYGATVITHRAIQSGLKELTFLIQKRPGFKEVWQREIGIDPFSSENLAQIFIEMALMENPKGTILFSSTKSERIKGIARAVNFPMLGMEGCNKIRNIFDSVHIKQLNSVKQFI